MHQNRHNCSASSNGLATQTGNSVSAGCADWSWEWAGGIYQ